MKMEKCHEPDCMLNAEVAYSCTSPDIYFCQLHAEKHIKLPEKAHALEKPRKSQNQRILLLKKSKTFKLKKFISQSTSLENGLRDLKSELLNRPNNQELEQKFRELSLLYKSDPNSCDSPDLIQSFQDCSHIYHIKSSIYNFKKIDRRANLLIYDTESETKSAKILDIPEDIFYIKCITQLPNGKLFFYAINPSVDIFLIDVDGEIQKLKPEASYKWSSAIYFNNCIYCFGDFDGSFCPISTTSKFDLNENRWIQLAQMKHYGYGGYHSIIFNGNILISRAGNRNILLYTIDIDSFSTISYEFGEGARKILVRVQKKEYFWLSGTMDQSMKAKLIFLLVGSELETQWSIMMLVKFSDHIIKDQYILDVSFRVVKNTTGLIWMKNH